MHAPRFTLRAIFAATAFVAVCAALWVADASWQSGLLVLLAMIIVPTAFARGAATSRGTWRAFFVGAFAVMLLAAIAQTTSIFHAATSLYVTPAGPYSANVTLPYFLGMISGQKRGVVALWVVAVLSGFIAQIVHAVIRDRTEVKDAKP